MKKILVITIVLAVGLTVLGGYLFQAQLGPILTLIVDWGILLVGVTGLIGIGYLFWMHLEILLRKERGAFFSLIVVLSFLFTLVAGFAFSSQSDFFRHLILNIQIPVEASLLAILAVIILSTSLRLIRVRGWTPMSISFLSSAVILLILDLGFIPTESETFLADLVIFLRRLPLAGARGILLGMALGGLIVGLKVLLTIDRPYGEE